MRFSFPVLVFSFLFFSFFACGCSKKTQSSVTPPPLPPANPTSAKSFYVSALTGIDANNGLSSTAPFKTINNAINSVEAGDTVFLMNGTYSSPIAITKSGSAEKYITLKAFKGHVPKLFVSGNNWNAVIINGSYIVLEGIALEGNSANLTYANAFAAFSEAAAGGTNWNSYSQYNTNGITIGGPRTESRFPHHVVIRNCKVHDFPGGGISAIQADYITIEGNTIFNNAWYMMYGGSGISILHPFNSDGADISKYKNVVRNNIVYGNKTTIPWIGLTPPKLSDGNGIIIDINRYPYGGSDASGNPYKGRTLVENNVSFNNGGSGIHAYKADHVDIVNNTAYGNGTVVGYPDIFGNNSNDVKIVNNIMYARSGGQCNSKPSTGTTTVYDYNIYFNGTYFKATNDKVIDPQFITVSTDGAVANFSLNSASPAIDAGTKNIYALKDLNGIIRPKGITVDCGAYEVR